MSEPGQPSRRSTHVAHEVVYAAVGASADHDLQRFPPEGSTPFEYAFKIGSGAERFLMGTNTLMTWGAQRAAGIEVTDIEVGSEPQYSAITFTHDGSPEPAPEAEVRYGSDGEAFL